MISKIIQIIKNIINDGFLRHNLIFFIGSMVAAFFSYLYHPALGRMMDIEDFGEVQTIISLSVVAGVFLAVFSHIAINVTSNIDDQNLSVAIIHKLKKISLLLIVPMVFALFVFSSRLKEIFNFKSPTLFFYLAIFLLISVSVTFRSAYLQGVKNFKAVSIKGIISAVGRLVFAILLVWLGLRAFGAIAALILSEVIGLLYLIKKIKKIKKSTDIAPKFFKKDFSKVKIKNELFYGFLVLTVIGNITFFTSADVLWIKHYFEPQTAGIYAGIATIARIIFFLTGSVKGVLFPYIKIKNHFRMNHKIFVQGLAIIAILGGAALLFFLLFPNLVIKLTMGQRYLALANILPKLSLMLFFMSVVNLIFFYLLALRKYIVAAISVSSVFIVSILSLFFHQNVEQIINNFLIGSVAAVILSAIVYAKINFGYRAGLQ